MIKVLVKYPEVYNTPFKIHTCKTSIEALDLVVEVQQGFGQAIALTEEEYKELINIVKNNG